MRPWIASLSWPEERQEDAVNVLTQMEEYDASDYRLTDEQAEEVRRLAEKNPNGRHKSRLKARSSVVKKAKKARRQSDVLSFAACKVAPH